jgi:ABC-type multidrug transport system fused ATPase/permease subunit
MRERAHGAARARAADAGLTVLIIAHRSPHVRHADRIAS